MPEGYIVKLTVCLLDDECIDLDLTKDTLLKKVMKDIIKIGFNSQSFDRFWNKKHIDHLDSNVQYFHQTFYNNHKQVYTNEATRPAHLSD